MATNNEHHNWFDIPVPDMQWLVEGLITIDGYTACSGKPKSGKSTGTRSMAASVVTGGDFLGRKIGIPANTGRCLYVHLDRKDPVWRVAKEFRELLKQDRTAAERLHLRTFEDVPLGTIEERLEWLRAEAAKHKPHLIVIDLLWQFLPTENTNAYEHTIGPINKLQDALRTGGYKGAVVAVLHNRKQVSVNDQFDDVLGSTGQRGSFGTILMFTHRREPHDVYTVASDQTDRDDQLGEIPERVSLRGTDGRLTLGDEYKSLLNQEKKDRRKADLDRIAVFVDQNPGTDEPTLMKELRVSKARLLDLLASSVEFIRREGNGVKGDPYRFYSSDYSKPQEANQQHAADAG